MFRCTFLYFSVNKWFRFLALALLGVVSADMGWDGIQSVSQSGFSCLKSNGFSFYIARVWTSVGSYDNTGIQNIKNARAGMFRDALVVIVITTAVTNQQMVARQF